MDNDQSIPATAVINSHDAEYLELMNHILCAGVDRGDRLQVVRMWRAMGLKCVQVADGYF